MGHYIGGVLRDCVFYCNFVGFLWENGPMALWVCWAVGRFWGGGSRGGVGIG